jgi:hypothetical protein
MNAIAELYLPLAEASPDAYDAAPARLRSG